MRFYLLHLYVLSSHELLQFLGELIDSYVVYAPVKRNDIITLDHISRIDDILIDFVGHTLIPFKKILIPPREILYRYRVNEDSVDIIDELNNISKSKYIIFGARACDIRGIEILDKVFLREFHDPYYKIRRENTLIIGLTCTSIDDNCFCYFTKSGPMIKTGYDLLLTRINNNEYLVETGSQKGTDIVEKYRDLFRGAPPTYLEIKSKIINRLISEMKSRINLPYFDSIYDELIRNYNSDKWAEISSLCLSCGKCNFVCPTCHCFDIYDEFDPIRGVGGRIRVWDSCHFLSFTRVASGEIFRKDRSSRIKQRIYHKVVYSVNEMGEISCTGCGRCISVCPAGIDIRKIINDFSG